ncbi:hypothetical protein BAUCODRAFT_34610, partial [Baudoinia panamericana UAMH 10762]
MTKHSGQSPWTCCSSNSSVSPRCQPVDSYAAACLKHVKLVKPLTLSARRPENGRLG